MRFVRLRTDPAGTRHMAGFFAVRMLRQGREGGFNPFGENPGDDDDDDDDDEDDGDDVEEAPELTEEDERKYSTAPKVDKASHWEYDAAVALEDAAAPAGSAQRPIALSAIARATGISYTLSSVSETRIVSPSPSSSSEPMPIALLMRPSSPSPASVTPRWSG